LFRPIPSHSIRICLSYYPPIPRLFPFDQSSSNAIAGDCIERLAFNGVENGAARPREKQRPGVGARRSKDQFVQDSSRSAIPISYEPRRERRNLPSILPGRQVRSYVGETSFLFSSPGTDPREFLYANYSDFRASARTRPRVQIARLRVSKPRDKLRHREVNRFQDEIFLLRREER
jgi:hypothetical protein